MKKFLIIIVTLLEINIVFINISNGSYLDGTSSTTTQPYAPGMDIQESEQKKNDSKNDSNDYYVITDNNGNSVKFSKNKLKDDISELEAENIVTQINHVNVDLLDAKSVIIFNEVLEKFYSSGAFKKLKNDSQEKYYSEIYDYSDSSVSGKLYKRADYWLDGKGYSVHGGQLQDDAKKLEKVKENRKNEKFSNGSLPPPSSAAAGQGGDTSTSVTDEKKEEEKNRQYSIYQNPMLNNSGRDSSSGLDDMISDADSFLNQGDIMYDKTKLQNFSSTLFNILSIVGAAVAIIVGIIIGIKYMTGSIEEKATYKEMLVPYLVGCVVVFSAFGIWAFIISILENI